MTHAELVAQMQGCQHKIIAQLDFGKAPMSILPSGQHLWSMNQIAFKEHIRVGMVLVRVVGDDQVCEVVVVVGEAFEKRPDSWWYRAIPLENPTTIYNYSLGDAGVTEGVGGWSLNFLADTKYSVDESELKLLLLAAKPFP